MIDWTGLKLPISINDIRFKFEPPHIELLFFRNVELNLNIAQKFTRKIPLQRHTSIDDVVILTLVFIHPTNGIPTSCSTNQKKEMTTDLQQQSSVLFHTVSIRKNYAFGEDLTASFTVNNYQSTEDDCIGIFEADSPSNIPLVSKSLLPFLTRIDLKIDFMYDATTFELRYLNKDKEVCSIVQY